MRKRSRTWLKAIERESHDKERGQIMPLGLAGLVCCVLLLGLVFRLGQRDLQQERVRMRADVTAYSAGIQLARCLNILALSEKMRIVARDAVYTEEIAEAIAQFQKVFIQAAPWAVEADTLFIGYRNGILAMPVWNQADMAGGDAASGICPSLKISDNGSSPADKTFKQINRIALYGPLGLMMADLDEGANQVGNKGQTAGFGGAGNDFSSMGKMIGGLTGGALGGGENSEGGYHYQGKDGQIHNLDDSQADVVEEHGPQGSTVTRYKDNKTHKYVAKNKGGDNSGGLSDQGGHFLGVWAVQNSGGQNLGWVLACSQIRVAGGDVNSSDHEHGADYRPFFVPARGPSDDEDDQGGDADENQGDSGGASAILGLASGLGADLGPVAAAFSAGSQAMEIQH